MWFLEVQQNTKRPDILGGIPLTPDPKCLPMSRPFWCVESPLDETQFTHFSTSFLLPGDLPPILVSLVHKEKGSMHMLDPSGNKEVKMELDECKEKITANLQKNVDVNNAPPEVLEQLVGPQELTSLHKVLKDVGNPRKTLLRIHQTMGELIDQLEEMLGLMGSGDELRIEGGEGLKGEHEDDIQLSGVKLYKGETLLELCERWRFLFKNLYDPDNDEFDLSRIPDVHDNVRFE